MMRFGAMVGGGLSLAFCIVAFTPLRDLYLVDLMGETAGGDVMAFAVPAIMLAVLLPMGNGIRFGLRGVLISRGHTRAITVSNISALLILASAVSFDLLPFEDNGALNAYVYWNVTTVVEMAILGRMVRSPREPDGGLPAPLRSPRESSAG